MKNKCNHPNLCTKALTSGNAGDDAVKYYDWCPDCGYIRKHKEKKEKKEKIIKMSDEEYEKTKNKLLKFNLQRLYIFEDDLNRVRKSILEILPEPSGWIDIEDLHIDLKYYVAGGEDGNSPGWHHQVQIKIDKKDYYIFLLMLKGVL